MNIRGSVGLIALAGILLSVFLTVCLSVPLHGEPANRQGIQEHDPIKEEVDVVNIQVPVRVFFKKKPVKGLKKDDFKLFLDGRETTINGFYEARQQLKVRSEKTTSAHKTPRLFVAVFNISAVSSDLEKGLQTLFKQLIRRNDRLLVITNTMVLNDHIVEDPQKEMNKIQKLVKIEARRINFKLLAVESSIRFMANTLKTELDTGKHRDPEAAVKRFLVDYQNTFNEFKQIFFSPPEEQYIKIAAYLKKQQVEKYVFHFYQVPRFPLLKVSGGTLYKAIEGVFNRSTPNPYTHEMLPQMSKPQEKDFIQTIGKHFLNSGASFHTLLMAAPIPRQFEEFDYRPVTTDSEHIFRQVALDTGGKVIASNNMGKFLKGINKTEDVCYMITYAPGVSQKKGKVTVTLSNPRFRRAQIVYDNQQRPSYFKKIAKKVEKEIPYVRIREIEHKEGNLSIGITGVHITPDEENGENHGRLLLNIKLLNDNAVLLSSAQKAFKTRAASVPLSLRLPGMKKGAYQVMLEVNDLNSGRNDLDIIDLGIPNDITLPDEQVAYQFIKVPVQRKSQAAAGAGDSGLEELKAEDPLFKSLQDSLSTTFSTDGIRQDMVPAILTKVAQYCTRLEAVSLNFFCTEEIDEKVLNAVQRKGKILKRRTVTHNKFTYGYRLIREANSKTVRENRILFKQNGWKREKENAELKTRFKYKNIVFGPTMFNRRSQPYYQYEIIGKRRWNQRNALIVEAVPNSEGDPRFAAGRIWVDEKDFSILRIEIYQQSIKNFEEIAQMADKHKVTPRITIINEYDVVKNGIRFPSRVYYEEAYKGARDTVIIQSQAAVTFKDYKFYNVKTDIKY